MNGIIGKGTTLGAAATSTTVPLANIMDVTLPDEKYGKVEVTEYADAIEAFIAGWKNAGNAAVAANGQVNRRQTALAA